MSGATLGLKESRPFFVHPHALVETADIGPNTRVWAFAHVMKGVRIGADCNIGDHAFLESGVVIGNNVTVKNGVAIWDRVTVEDNVFLGPNCVLTNDRNPRAYIKKSGFDLTPTLIHSNATVGANATIVCGVTLGHYSFVGAGAVVIRSAPDFALVVGNPGRQRGWMCVCAETLPLPASAPLNSRVRCPSCGRSYRLESGGLSLTTENVAQYKENR
jgi:UDP-2-acetamido-3-amino-2,3-dideoxy-glucuronate N-acetyltransferase